MLALTTRTTSRTTSMHTSHSKSSGTGGVLVVLKSQVNVEVHCNEIIYSEPLVSSM